MTSPDHPLTAEELLAHAGFIRAIASAALGVCALSQSKRPEALRYLYSLLRDGDELGVHGIRGLLRTGMRDNCIACYDYFEKNRVSLWGLVPIHWELAAFESDDPAVRERTWRHILAGARNSSHAELQKVAIAFLIRRGEIPGRQQEAREALNRVAGDPGQPIASRLAALKGFMRDAYHDDSTEDWLWSILADTKENGLVRAAALEPWAFWFLAPTPETRAKLDQLEAAPEGKFADALRRLRR